MLWITINNNVFICIFFLRARKFSGVKHLERLVPDQQVSNTVTQKQFVQVRHSDSLV